ncbi:MULTISPECIES: DUF1697 domain-containing protein [unclassified Bacillus (in: firmicutes)]|uniref:DUF1697 domain-containing protein n=1 Tax=unclassified Bacillus (in: firmicutes) TaxID=185979 RepID=UPI0008E1FD85|nr:MULTISPECIES: DUF1697 domain-containing protein [unclassified Bacillus (in: firmicutes)]SFB06965.1 Uncharacterized conserved protein, DUF1697 family [Bacillus sp. UNCCL13]SFQ87511.1 Uncharacterized conserved protein, DUF1697 family [Bacillus sp. cl95]
MIYVALLRGINVGGHNKIKMAELKDAIEAVGLNGVQTYIQSGNVIFETSDRELVSLRVLLEQVILERFGMNVPVVLREAHAFTRLVRDCPFRVKDVKNDLVHVAFLQSKASVEAMAKLEQFESDVDEYRLDGKDIYLLLREGVRNSKLLNQLSKIGIPVTVRNWKTVNKLVDMVEGRIS